MAKNAFNEAPASWGPPPLTARPEGLLSSLGIQSGGLYPQTLLKELQPTYELGAWYREYNGTFNTATGSLIAFGPGGAVDLFTVPDGELWIVRRVGLTLTTTGGAVATYRTRYIVVRTNAANATVLPMTEPVSVTMYNTANNAVAMNASELNEVILRPTVKVRLLGLDNDGGNYALPGNGTYTCSIAFTRCRI